MPRDPKLFMWSGGKGKMLTHYAPHLPTMPAGGYVEPFAGGAALFSHLRKSRPVFKAHLGDVNGEIIRLYEEVRDNPERLIRNLRPYAQAWDKATETGRKELYYEKRKLYWATDEGPEATALLYGLMRTGFNGVWQTCQESRGRFGTPVGLTNKSGHVLDETVIRTWSAYLADTTLSNAGFLDQNIPESSFVFCDPPYRDSFTTYGTVFGDAEQRALIAWCRDLHRNHDCTVWLANRDAGDGFFERECPEARLLRFPVIYTAGRRKRVDGGFEAKPATELLIIWDRGNA